VQSLIDPGIAAVFLLGLITRKITPAAGFVGLVAGVVLGMFRLVLLPFKDSLQGTILAPVTDMNWLYFCILLFVLVCAVMIITSIFTKQATDEQIDGLTFGCLGKARLKEVAESMDIWDYVHTAGILGITVLIYYRFW
ncbi:MAG: Na+/glucose cotransporter, partial [Paraglaciecola sp.]|nr:Na+/glucose cotransporter [Paraglaciecola sp.]